MEGDTRHNKDKKAWSKLVYGLCFVGFLNKAEEDIAILQYYSSFTTVSLLF